MGEGNVLTRVCPSVCPQGGEGWVSGGGGVGQVQLPGGRGGSAGGEGWVSRGGRGGSAMGRGEGWVSHGGEGWVSGGRGGSATGGEGGSGPGGRYASCVHAGGLSCWPRCFTLTLAGLQVALLNNLLSKNVYFRRRCQFYHWIAKMQKHTHRL